MGEACEQAAIGEDGLIVAADDQCRPPQPQQNENRRAKVGQTVQFALLPSKPSFEETRQTGQFALPSPKSSFMLAIYLGRSILTPEEFTEAQVTGWFNPETGMMTIWQ
jgi:hypothetical protein